ncbi:MAG TPA: hypothetical protein VI455_01325 [Terriglobia bacterium]
MMLVVAVSLFAGAAAAQGVEPCRNGTLASYAGTSCSQGQIVYHFPRNFYNFSGSGIATIGPERVLIRMDPQGPYTLLIGFADWALQKPGQSFDITLNFSVSGATKIESWIHRCEATGTARIYASQTVKTNPPVTTTTFCDGGGGMRERTRDVSYGGGTVDTVVSIHAESGTGTADFRSFGTHYKP